MKTPFYLIITVPLLFVSCSSFQKVSSSNFTKYEITSNDRENLHYVLKKQKLHYSVIDLKENINFYTADSSIPYYSRSAVYEENIVIPRGAKGQCIPSQDNELIIDFGEGMLLSFRVLKDDNRTFAKIELDGRIYTLTRTKREASLYFDPIERCNWNQ